LALSYLLAVHKTANSLQLWMEGGRMWVITFHNQLQFVKSKVTDNVQSVISQKESYVELSKISRFMIKNDNYRIMWEKQYCLFLTHYFCIYRKRLREQTFSPRGESSVSVDLSISDLTVCWKQNTSENKIKSCMCHKVSHLPVSANP